MNKELLATLLAMKGIAPDRQVGDENALQILEAAVNGALKEIEDKLHEPKTEVDFDELAEFAKSLGLDEQDFDGQVHDSKSEEASDINNSGMASQLEFIYGGLPLDMIKAELQQLAGNESDEEDDLDDD